jgi:tRNA(His) 5'-end guanylyltransferase
MSKDHQDPLGDEIKELEMQEAGRKLMPGIPVIARLDGRSFHSFCRNLNKPFDENFHTCMVETTKALVEEFTAAVGYTQSDEITLAWNKPEMFDGRFQKLTSVLSGFASSVFTLEVLKHLPGKEKLIPCFDCRVWQMPSPQEALKVFYWREADAVKNSVSQATRAYYSHNQVNNKKRPEMMDMLREKGINWNEYEPWKKRGVYVKRKTFQRTLTHEERMNIPESNRPEIGQLFTRSKVEIIDLPPLRKVLDPAKVIFAKNIPEREDHHSRQELLLRNGRWGTCADCPRISGKVYPEHCQFTDRYDHLLTAKDN